MRPLTNLQEASIRGLRLEHPTATVKVDGFEDEDVRVHVIARESRHGYVIAVDGELVTSTPINAAGEPMDVAGEQSA
jgi:hypothetical protein